MIGIARTDTSIIGRWWWTVDRWMLLAIALLIALGAILLMAASPAVADRLGLDTFYFARRQFSFLVFALLLLFGTALLSPLGVRRVAAAGFVVALGLMTLTLMTGAPINGARRWLDLGPLIFQPSEFVKPTFAVVTAWVLAAEQRAPDFPGKLAATALLVVVFGLLLAQPDIGMMTVVGAVWFVQLFMAGLALPWLGGLAVLGAAGAATVYLVMPHVAGRVDRFLDPASGDSYQIDTALQAFGLGGLFGRGPGEGVVKQVLPDAHTDFVFAVAAEEFGLVACLLLVGLFAAIVLRGLSWARRENNYFVLLAASGLVTQFGLQAVINMGVNLRLLPTKGMTLPFISYGGSSLLALALGMGMILALTRRRVSGGRTVEWSA